MQQPFPYVWSLPRVPANSLLGRVAAWPGPHLWQRVSATERGWLEALAWLLALAWVVRTSDALRYLPTLPWLTGVEWDIEPAHASSLTVIVPARDEEAKIAATLEALLASDYAALHIVAIDDRSTDQTGAIMDRIADAASVTHPGQLELLHVHELPEGWLGKVYAMELAMQHTRSEYILFTDADVLFSPSILRRSVAYAEASEADHLVVLPTMQSESWGESMMLGYLHLFSLWAARLWKVADPRAKRDIIGVGAFNLVRRSALEELGGLPPQRMTILEDITLGRRMKAAGMRQRVVFAPGLVLVHWAKGARGIVRVMTKNLFSAFNFHPLLLLGACAGLSTIFLLPLAGLLWWSTMVPALLVMACVGAYYRVQGEVSLVPARYAWLYPVGAVLFIAAMLRSMTVTLLRGGVRWRDTFYSLRELRQHNSPFVWEREAEKLREERRRLAKAVRRQARKDAQG